MQEPSYYCKRFFTFEKAESGSRNDIQQLKDFEELLLKKEDFLEKKIESELKAAKINRGKDKRAALQALKRKKQYEKQLRKIDDSLSTVEFQIEALENASTNTEVLRAMQGSAEALDSTHVSMDVDKVHDLLDDLNEQQELANEISEAISKPIGLGSDSEIDDLELELQEIGESFLDSQKVNDTTRCASERHL